MALTEDDVGLARELRELLAENGAEWIAEQVDDDLASAQEASSDPTIEATALLMGISQSLGAIPEMLLDANQKLERPSLGCRGRATRRERDLVQGGGNRAATHG